MSFKHALWLVGLYAFAMLADLALAGPAAHEEVLRIPYGAEVGSLDPTRVDADNPQRTLVQSFTVETDGSVWVLPRVEVSGRTTLYRYEDGTFTGELRFEGYPMGFLRAPEGVYSWSAGANAETAALVAFDPRARWTDARHDDKSSGGKHATGEGSDGVRSDGVPWDGVRRARLATGPVVPAGFDGWLGWAGQGPALFGRGSDNAFFTVNLGEELPVSDLLPVTRGLATPGSMASTMLPLSQETKWILRGDKLLYEIELAEEWLVAALPSGGFVTRTRGEQNGEILNPRFEVRNANGKWVRTIVTLPRTDTFEVGSSPWFFTEEHCYQLLLGADHGRVVRY